MDSNRLADYGRTVQVLIGSATRVEVDKAVARLVADEAWDLCGQILASASELGARTLIARLLEAKVYGPLACAASTRRQVKRQQVQTRKTAMSRRVFRDLDTETDDKAIPDHIQAELDDLATGRETWHSA